MSLSYEESPARFCEETIINVENAMIGEWGAHTQGAILPFHPSHLERFPFCLLNYHS